MRMLHNSRNAIYLTGCAILFLAVCIFSEDYTISSFATGTRTIPPSGNEVIIPFEGTVLKQVTSVPDLKPGELVLRRRFSATEYGLFVGKMSEEATTLLSAFRPEKDSGFNMLIATKFYTRESNNPDLDIPNVYFNDSWIYVENVARLFYNNGTWKTIELLVGKQSEIPDPPLFYEDFSGIKEGMFPENWKGGSTLGVYFSQELNGHKVLKPFKMGKHEFVLPAIKVSGDFAFETTLKLKQSSITFTIGNVVVAIEPDALTIDGKRIQNKSLFMTESFSLIRLEKKGKRIVLLINKKEVETITKLDFKVGTISFEAKTGNSFLISKIGIYHL